MKKIFIILLAISSIFLITGCGKQETKEEKNSNQNINEKKEEININKDTKSIVVYFSATGTTKEMAEYLKEATNSDIEEIIPKEKYTSEDLNYNNNASRANKEQQDDASRPEIFNLMNLEEYDIIYLGYPIWWGVAPKIINTLLDTYNLDGKIVVPFCTSGSSSITESIKVLKEYKPNINWQDGRRLSSKDDVDKWVKEIIK